MQQATWFDRSSASRCGFFRRARGCRRLTPAAGRVWGGAMFCSLAVLQGPGWAAMLDVSVVEEGSKTPPVARVLIRDAGGKDHVPGGATVVAVGKKDRWFVAAGAAKVEVPAGKVEIRVERGTEYRPVKEAIEVAEGRGNRFEARLRRWIDMRQRGYLCGENHLHMPPDALGPQLAAEGLDFGTVLQWWNGPKFEIPPGEGFVRDLVFADVRTPASCFDIELEHEWGAAYLVGFPRPLDAKSDPRQPNLPIVRQARELGALVCYQGGWSREVLLDALLGYVDVVNVCNNNFARHHFQPRSFYSNLLDVPGFPVYPDTPEGMMRMNTDTYYRLLNCGLRLAAGAGSATGAKTCPVGYNRAYVRTTAETGLPGFLNAWRAGRNFVTDGPMLFLTVNDRLAPGDTLALAEAGEVEFAVEAVSEQPLTSLEVVVNGRVAARLDDVKGTEARLTGRLRVAEGSWLAARCTEDDRLLSDAELADYSFGDRRMLRRPSRLRFAHTSPVYITLGGAGTRVESSLDEARRMLDAFEAFGMRKVGDEYRDELSRAIRTARERLGG